MILSTVPASTKPPKETFVVDVPWLVVVVGSSWRLLNDASWLSLTRSSGVERMFTSVVRWSMWIRRGTLPISPLVMPTKTPAISAGTVVRSGKPAPAVWSRSAAPKFENPLPRIRDPPCGSMVVHSVPKLISPSFLTSRIATSKSTCGRRTSSVANTVLTSSWMYSGAMRMSELRLVSGITTDSPSK